MFGSPGVPLKDRPQTLSSLSSCSCERSASALRRLNTHLRCTQTEERLTALALIHTCSNYESKIDVERVCKLKFPRRMECGSLLFK